MIEKPVDLPFLRDCLREAGQIALHRWGLVTASIKADHTPVTEVDHQVERFLMERIAARYPDHPVLSEESGLHSAAAETTWVIDPIDGTRSFASGLPIWGVSVGVIQAGEPVCGGFYLPVTGEMFWGSRTQAFYNDRLLPPAAPPDLESVLNFLAVPSNFYLDFDVTFPRARSMGSTAAHLAYALTGAAAGVLLQEVSLWDIAGLLPLLAAAGIQITGLDGQAFQPAALLDGKKIRAPLLAAHPAVIGALRGMIRRKSRDGLPEDGSPEGGQ